MFRDSDRLKFVHRSTMRNVQKQLDFVLAPLGMQFTGEFVDIGPIDVGYPARSETKKIPQYAPRFVFMRGAAINRLRPEFAREWANQARDKTASVKALGILDTLAHLRHHAAAVLHEPSVKDRHQGGVKRVRHVPGPRIPRHP
jgi:hypothetical protein